MTDLLDLNAVLDKLTARAETRVLLSVAVDALQQMHDAYEADRVASEALMVDMRGQITRLVEEVSARGDTIATLQAKLAVATADVHVTVGPNSVTSRTIPAVSLVENPPIWTSASWLNAKVSLANLAYKTHIQPFGLSSPWKSDASGKLEVKPSQWYAGRGLGVQLQHMREIDATAPIILTLYGAEWWMMELVAQDAGAPGARTPKSYANRFDDNGRVAFAQLPNWLIEVDGAVTIAAGFGCRDFEVWNECKGYYGAAWDMSMTGIAGKPVGYGYFYALTAGQVVATMTRLGIARTDYRIAGPYVVFATRGDRTADALPEAHPLSDNRAKYGYIQKQPVNALRDFLRNARDNHLPLDMLALDASTYLKSGDYLSSNPFDYTRKFDDLLTYAETCLAEFGFDPHMDKVFSELYPTPDPAHQTADSEALRAALWADTLRMCVLHGVRYPIAWGPTSPAGGNFHELGALIDADGAMQAVGDVFKLFRENFGPSKVIRTISASDERVDGIASDSTALLYNKTPNALKVALGEQVVELSAYEVRGIAIYGK